MNKLKITWDLIRFNDIVWLHKKPIMQQSYIFLVRPIILTLSTKNYKNWKNIMPRLIRVYVSSIYIIHLFFIKKYLFFIEMLTMV